MPPSAAGLVLVNIFQSSAFVPFLMKLKAEFVAFINSLHRLFEYTKLQEEAPAQVENTKPDPSWPQSGSIAFDKVSFKYRPELPLVLKRVSVKIGQNSFTNSNFMRNNNFQVEGRKLVLLEELELENHPWYPHYWGSLSWRREGLSLMILILGLDQKYSWILIEIFIYYSEIGLKDLRSAIAVIPQDPILFQGTLRYNIDPFNQASDEKIWNVLEESNLKEKISKDSLGLEMFVEADGDNFSVGEKQLICLARALLRK